MMNLKKEISKSFNQQAQCYEKAAKVQHEIGHRLFERLDYLKIAPRYILDLGCGTGVHSSLLKRKYPKACIVSCDLALQMLVVTQKKQRLWRKWPLVNADMHQLPFADGVFDLVFANQAIHWSEAIPQVFRELNRVMNQEGCLMFSTLGPDTFKELRMAWGGVDTHAHTNPFIDMHDIGDHLLRERFAEPVVDMEMLTVQYVDLNTLLHSLKAQGVRNINPQRNNGWTGRRRWQQFSKNYQSFCTVDGKYPLSYEVVYGHAWKVNQHIGDKGIETFIPISQIQRK